MMLVTFTCWPPSCWAMLPQKFSAATTWIGSPDADAALSEAVLHPARASTATPTTVAARRAAFGREAMRAKVMAGAWWSPAPIVQGAYVHERSDERARRA